MRSILTASLAIGLLAALGGTASATVFYSQGFDSPDISGSTSSYLDEYGWQGHDGSSGDAAHTASGTWASDPIDSGGSMQLRVVDDAGAPSPSNRVFTYMGSPRDYMAWTADVNVALPSVTDLQISWYDRSLASMGFRAAVRVDDGGTTRWFASKSIFAGNGGNTWQQDSVDALATDWVEFAFDGTQTADATSGFNVDGSAAAVALPSSGTITGAGVYVEASASGTYGRVDSFEVNGTVPEPATMSLLLTLGGLFGLRRRR